MKPRSTLAPAALGSVRGDELLPKRVFCSRLGIGKAGWTVLVHNGLPTIKAGKLVFLDGRAVLSYFRTLADQQRQNRNRDGGRNNE